MAAPLQTGKRSVDLAAPAVRGSRIRREPPPVAKKVAEVDPEERDARTVILGVIAFALAFAIIIVGISSNLGNSSPSEHSVQLEL